MSCIIRASPFLGRSPINSLCYTQAHILWAYYYWLSVLENVHCFDSKTRRAKGRKSSAEERERERVGDGEGGLRELR